MRNPYAQADARHERQLDAALAAEYAANANAEYWRADCAALAGSLKAEFVGNCDENNPPQIEHWHIGECIEKNLAQYFRDLHGAEAGGVYDMVLMRVEKPMIAYVMAQCKGNQSKAAQVLGLNRNTLRKKLALHGFLDTPSS